MINHLGLDELYTLVFDKSATETAVAHLAACAQCRQEADGLRQLATDLAIARLIEPSASAIERYQAMFEHVRQQPSALRRVADKVRAVLTWDSRQQPALQGVRTAAATSYRQLYAADAVEIELMVERAGRLRRIEGDLIGEEPGDVSEPALVELLGQDGARVYMAETDENGLFRLEDVAPGAYRMFMTRARTTPIEIEALEIV